MANLCSGLNEESDSAGSRLSELSASVRHRVGPRSLPANVRAAAVVPNWNGASLLAGCLDSLLNQSVPVHVIVVDNGSTDDSLAVLGHYPAVEIIRNSENKGFAGGVNPGLKRAIELGLPYVATFNSDAVADREWLRHLTDALDTEAATGIATCKLLTGDGSSIDSTGDCFTSWGVAFPRGRHEWDLTKYDGDRDVFGASGGASLYRTEMLADVGLFDEDYFAYFEDVDLSFRTQLAGWRVRYVPDAIVYHQIGATSSKISGFVTHQTARNTTMVVLKNVPRRYLWHVGPRHLLAQLLFLLWATRRHQLRWAIKGYAGAIVLLPSTLRKRRQIQRTRRVPDEYIWGQLIHGFPPRDPFGSVLSRAARRIASVRSAAGIRAAR